MIVVSDTSVISNLYLIGHLDLLQKLFTTIIIPQKVHNELLELRQFGVDVQPIVGAIYIKVQTPENQALVREFLLNIDEGEAQAIVLAKEIGADLLLIDELKGRAIAEQQGLKITGLLGVLLQAKQHGFLPVVKPILERLRDEANFFLSDRLFSQIVQLAGE